MSGKSKELLLKIIDFFYFFGISVEQMKQRSLCKTFFGVSPIEETPIFLDYVSIPRELENLRTGRITREKPRCLQYSVI